MYVEAGADALFVEAPQSEAEIEAVARTFPDVPLLFNYAEGGKTPAVSHARLRELGFSLVIFPLTLLLVATQAMRAALARVKADGTPIDLLGSLLPFDDFLSFIGLPEIRELEQRFAER
jgi:2-methylisocitrate lyase-like PEP mutase family enzyme